MNGVTRALPWPLGSLQGTRNAVPFFFFFWLTLIVTRYNSPEHVPHACPNAEYSKVPHLIERQDQKLLLLRWSLDLMF